MDRAWRVGLWCAVSSKPQAADDRVSLQEQERIGREFAASVGGEVVALYCVPGHSRDIIFWADAETDIPAYAQVRQDLESGAVDVIHCVDSDRLGRDPALVSQFYSLAEHHGAEVYDASMPHPLGQQSMGHRYGAAIKGVAAGEDQKRRIARHRMGMRGRVLRRGLHPTTWPIGYEPVRDNAGKVIGAQFDRLAGAVRLVTDLFLSGHSYSEIRRRLDASGYRPPRGVRWGYHTVRRILHNDTYAGFVSWGPFQADTPSDRFPAYWDEDTYQEILHERRRRKRAPYHRKGSGPLTGVAFCARCGGSMSRRELAGRYYLRCSSYFNAKRDGRRGCHHNGITEAEILDAVGDFLAYLSTPEVLTMALAQLDGAGEEAILREELAGVERALFATENKRRRLAHAYAAGDMEIGVYRRVDDDLRIDAETQAEQVITLERTLAALPDLDATREWLEELTASFPEMVAYHPSAEVAAALQTAGIRVYVEDGRITRIALE